MVKSPQEQFVAASPREEYVEDFFACFISQHIRIQVNPPKGKKGCLWVVSRSLVESKNTFVLTLLYTRFFWFLEIVLLNETRLSSSSVPSEQMPADTGLRSSSSYNIRRPLS